jgi:branched-subunit amino acid transport protein
MNEIGLVAGMAIVTFLIRYPVLAMSGRIKLSEQFLRALSYVPPAVLTAIVVPAVLIPDGEQIQFSYQNARLIGAIATVLVGIWRKSLWLTILAGMLTFFGWRVLLMLLQGD